jgi:hypothetical protein
MVSEGPYILDQEEIEKYNSINAAVKEVIAEFYSAYSQTDLLQTISQMFSLATQKVTLIPQRITMLRLIW